jgi:ring-1,2-phenylacetyl-CoA epoxidase subunit PaaD
MKETIAEIESILAEIPDPEIPVISIKELGILRSVEQKNDHYTITITPTYTACPAMGWIENEIKNKMANIGIPDVEVKTTYTPAWTTDWISENAKQKLKDYGIAPPMHSSCSVNFTSQKVPCPHCGSPDTEIISRFGSTACKSLLKCNECREPFEQFKCH